MKVFNLLKINSRPVPQPSVCCLGWFDGLHRGHQLLIKNTQQLATKRGVKSSVFTLTVNNHALFGKWQGRQIYQLWQKNKILGEMGVDYCFNFAMNKKQRKIDKLTFLQFLQNNLNVMAVVVGTDFRFGNQAKGQINDLINFFGPENVVTIPLVANRQGEPKISSTIIRNYMQTKQITTAYQQLYEPVIWYGRIVPGRGQGQKIGIPTLNQKLPASFCLPIGVYFSQVLIEQKWCSSVTCVWRPVADLIAETFVLNRKQIPPVKMLKVKYIKFWREFIPLDHWSEIKALILKDITAAKTFFAPLRLPSKMANQPRNIPFLITVEGLDGAGKSTFARNLSQILRTQSQLVWLVNGVEFGLPGPRAQQHYYRLARSEKQKYWFDVFAKLTQNYLAKCQKHARKTPIIICDRWYDSVIVYQGRTDQWQTMLATRTTLENQLKPQIKFLIKTPLPLIRQRWLAKGNHNWNTAVFTTFAKLYQRVIGDEPSAIILDGGEPLDCLMKTAQQHITNRLNVFKTHQKKS